MTPIPSDNRPMTGDNRPLPGDRPAATDTRSVPDLLSTLVTQMTTLVRQEVRLATTEVSENAGKAMNGVGMLAVAAVLAIPALVLLFQSIATFLVAAGMSIEWATLLVAIAAIVIAAILASSGMARLRATSLVPDRTIDQLQRDAAVAKDQVR